jgi:hypothetical protein
LLLDTFKLQLNDVSIETLAVDDWPNVAIKNIHIQMNGKKFDMDAYISIVNKYCTSVETMVINDVVLSFYEMKKLLKNMENLRILTLNSVGLSSKFINRLQLPKLTSLSVIYSTKYTNNQAEDILKAFKFNSLIETLAISNYSGISNEFFRGFIETLPKIKHLKLEGGIGNRLLRSDLPHKLETLNINSLNTDDNVQFLLNQTELKELRLEWLPNVKSAAFVKTIYEHLDTFYFRDALLIRNYQPQHVVEKLEFEWEAGLEVLKRGLCE